MRVIPLPDLNVIQYIPQRAPVVMIDELLSSSDGMTVTRFEVKENNLFVKDNQFTEAGLMENIAQTAAAGVGYAFALQEAPVPPGFIGALKNFKIERLPKVGEQLLSRVEILQEVFEITLIKGEINTPEGEAIASCEMKILLKK
jgi:3-hydroxyacyl-[acyl-carrier-protein] dehydratase